MIYFFLNCFQSAKIHWFSYRIFFQFLSTFQLFINHNYLTLINIILFFLFKYITLFLLYMKLWLYNAVVLSVVLIGTQLLQSVGVKIKRFYNYLVYFVSLFSSCLPNLCILMEPHNHLLEVVMQLFVLIIIQTTHSC